MTIFKNLLHVVAITAGILVLVLYVFLHYNLAGLIVENDIQQKLTEKLQARVEIGEIEVTWTNQIAMNQIVIYDQKEDTLLYARRAMIALEIGPLLNQQLIVNTIQLIDFDLFVRKESPDANTNYLFLVEALMPKQEDQQRKFLNDISIHALLLRQGKVSYDVLDQPYNTHPTIPDHNHISFSDLSARLELEVSHKTGLELNLKRMSWKEKCGIVLQNLKGKGYLVADSIRLENISIEMTHVVSDGTICQLETHGQAQIFDDSLSLQINNFDLEADTWGELHARLQIDTRLDSIAQNSYEAEFINSHISNVGFSSIANAFEFKLPNEIQTWIGQIEELHWQGVITGSDTQNYQYKGDISTKGVFSSRLTTNINYQAENVQPLTITLNGQIPSIAYLDHTYRNLSIEGLYNGQELIADFDSQDPMLVAFGHAEIAFNSDETNVQGYADIQRVNPYQIHLSELSNLEGLNFRGIVQMDISIPQSFNTENLSFNLNNYPTGTIRIDSLQISNRSEIVNLGTTRMTMQREQGSNVFAVVSPIANIVGTQTSIIGYLPTNPQFSHILKFPGELAQDMTIQAEWDTLRNHISINASIPEWKQDEASYSVLLKGEGQTTKESPMPTLMEANVQLAYKNETHELFSSLTMNYEPDPMIIQLAPSTLTIDGKQFNTTNAVLRQQDKESYKLDNLLVEDQDQKLEISGIFGYSQGMNMEVRLDKWQLDFFLDMLQKDYLDFGGYASGDIRLFRDSTLQFKTYSLAITDFTYIGKRLGDGDLTCFCDLDKGKLKFIADIESYPGHHTNAECDVRLHEVHDSIDLRVQMDSLPIEFLSYWVGGVTQDLHGHGTGEARLFGDCDSLHLVGNPLLQNVNFTNDLLGARFFITDTINLTSNMDTGKGFIGLNNVTVRDRNGQKAILTLDLEHKYLHNIEYGLDLDIPESNQGFLLYDHPTQNNGELYWGRLWATGRCQMHGTYSHHRINVQMSPSGRSIFNLSPGEENFTDNAYNFLTFRDKTKLEKEEEINLQALLSRTLYNKEEEDNEPTYIEADLLIHANEHCQVYVQLDPLAEDRLICRGNGDLALHYDPHHDLALTGNYDITSGSYTVTMKGDVMTKAFQLQPGSRVTFPGLPSDAELNLKAIYNIPSANLKDLDESFASLASLSRTTLPVDCKLNVTGPITAPQIAFDLEVKNTSDDVQALVHNIIGTQEMLNREVFYLLLFSKFYTPEYASTSQRQTGSELTSFASSSLTSQLNNLLGHMSDNFTLGTNFRSDKGDFSDMEMDFSVSTRLLNDRLLMTGNLGYRDPANSIGLNNTNNTFIGDFDVEFLINTKGTIRAKAYSHYNERDYSINNALTTQGIGIVLRKDFKSIYDLLKRKQ